MRKTRLLAQGVSTEGQAVTTYLCLPNRHSCRRCYDEYMTSAGYLKREDGFFHPRGGIAKPTCNASERTRRHSVELIINVFYRSNRRGYRSDGRSWRKVFVIVGLGPGRFQVGGVAMGGSEGVWRIVVVGEIYGSCRDIVTRRVCFGGADRPIHSGSWLRIVAPDSRRPLIDQRKLSW